MIRSVGWSLFLLMVAACGPERAIVPVVVDAVEYRSANGLRRADQPRSRDGEATWRLEVRRPGDLMSAPLIVSARTLRTVTVGDTLSVEWGRGLEGVWGPRRLVRASAHPRQ